MDGEAGRFRERGCEDPGRQARVRRGLVGTAVAAPSQPRIVCGQGDQVVLVVKNPPANEGDLRDAGSTPGSGRVPGGGRGNPLHYSCWEKSHGQRSLVGYSLCGHKELGMTEATTRTGRPRVRKSGIFCLSTVAVGMSLCSSLRLSKAQVPHI